MNQENIDNQAQEHWLSHIRHELKTPVNAIIGYSEMMIEEVEEIEKFGKKENVIITLNLINNYGKNVLELINVYFHSEGLKFQENKFNYLIFLQKINLEFEQTLINILEKCQILLSVNIKEVNEFEKDIKKIQISTKKLFNQLKNLPNIYKNFQYLSPKIEEKNIPLENTNIKSNLSIKKINQGSILVVDDHENNCDLLQRRLKNQGYDINIANSGKEALEIVKIVEYDLILLDVMMPEMNGYEVLKQLKNDEILRIIPVIMISALDEIDIVIKCIEMGAEDYLQKPFNATLLKARIDACLEKKRLRDQEIMYIKELKRTQSQLIQSAKMSGLGQIVAGIAHEINNPIGFIYSNIAHANNYIQDLFELINIYQEVYPNPSLAVEQLIENIDLEFIQEDLYKLMNSMEIGAKRINNIVLNLRNFSRLDEAKMKPVDIHQGIDNSLMLLQHKLASQENLPKIKVIKEYSKFSEINCYANQINQVFMNVLNNAIDALRKKPLINNPKIRIVTQKNDKKNIIIRIIDNGCGISPELQKKIFEPFFTTKAVGSGIGLGLSSSYEIIVEIHQGKLQCQSELGKGTEFTIEIPELS